MARHAKPGGESNFASGDDESLIGDLARQFLDQLQAEGERSKVRPQGQAEPDSKDQIARPGAGPPREPRDGMRGERAAGHDDQQATCEDYIPAGVDDEAMPPAQQQAVERLLMSLEGLSGRSGRTSQSPPAIDAPAGSSAVVAESASKAGRHRRTWWRRLPHPSLSEIALGLLGVAAAGGLWWLGRLAAG
jgi:hypothetical protein